MNKLLSVVIVTFKSNKVVFDCLKSIEKYNDLSDKLEVIVVDNHPFNQDAFADIASSFPWVISIANPENGGFGQGNNKGVEISQGQYVLFLNPDTELIEPIFKYAINQFETDCHLAIFGMLLYDRNGKICGNSFGIMPECKGLLPATFWLPFIKYIHYTPRHIFPLGADMFVRKDIFEGAGGFDESMFLCYEEPDLVRRIPHNYHVKIFNKSILHLEGHTTESVGSERRISWALESEQYYFRKHKLNYIKYSIFVMSTLLIKKLARLFLGRTACRVDIQLAEHYWRVIRRHVS
jgi:GT2 family glycosyltransferase